MEGVVSEMMSPEELLLIVWSTEVNFSYLEYVPIFEGILTLGILLSPVGISTW